MYQQQLDSLGVSCWAYHRNYTYFYAKMSPNKELGLKHTQDASNSIVSRILIFVNQLIAHNIR